MFVLLPVLEASASHFTSKDQLLSENRELNALRVCKNLDLSIVCEEKEAGGDKYYKLDKQKLMSWLKTRVARVRAVLKSQRICGAERVC